MNLIFPRGGANYSWQSKEGEAPIGLDAISTDELKKLAMNDMESEMMDDEMVEVEVVEEMPEDDSAILEVSDDVEDLGEDLGEDSLEDKLDGLQDAAEEVAEKVEEIKEELSIDVEETEDGEIEISEDVDMIVDINEDAIEDVELEATERCLSCGASTKEGKALKASSSNFVKIAKLSSENKKLLNDYWVNMLAYPKDYVDDMLKDYE